jgi:hypothetical protein
MNNPNNVVLAIIGALVIGATGFFIGRHVDARIGTIRGNTKQMMTAGFGFGGRGMMGRRNPAGFGAGSGGGQITAINGNTVTVQLADGTTRDITLSSDVVVNMLTKATVGDLKIGQTIMVTGGGFWDNSQTVIVKPQ